MKRANNLGCDFIATGHYAQIREENTRYVISRGLDRSKDQSYALWGVAQEHLARTIFPLGGYSKRNQANCPRSWFIECGQQTRFI